MQTIDLLNKHSIRDINKGNFWRGESASLPPKKTSPNPQFSDKEGLARISMSINANGVLQTSTENLPTSQMLAGAALLCIHLRDYAPVFNPK